jgi:membrane glycosyltransferase
MDSLTTPIFQALPGEAPLAMPVRSLRVAPAVASRPPSSPRAIGLRRLLVIGGAVALTAAGGWQMKLVVAANGLTPLAVVLLALFLALFAWIALSFTSAIAGFVSLLAGGGRRLGIASGEPPPAPTTRTALLMPCYNENPARVMAGLQAIWESARDAGQADAFDIFILSDTTDPDVWLAEEDAFLALRRRTGSTRIFYRRRKKNTARKAGNIADWVARWGGAYRQFLILDADSVMRAETLLWLVAAMEAHEDVGIIQTLPIITGGGTLFARSQQFAGRVYGPLIAQGIAWWHGAEGNYWGHNAMIRTRAFAEQAGLPELRGRKPFGGHIMSHDFVEAALIRRAGWAVHMVPALAGSYEESPPGLIDLAVRDRRWCQGNLQHIAVLPARGLHWVSRLHLLTGIGSYITAPLWLMFMLTGILIALRERVVQPDYFPAGKALFPVWPVIDPVRAMWVFVGTMGLLLLPKLLGGVVILSHGPDRRGCGGAARMTASLLIETLIAGLIAPVMMLTQTVDVVSILSGRDSGWNPQRREGGAVPLGDTARRYRSHTVMGVAMGGIAWLVSPSLALWMAPVVLGLALAIPLATITGRRDRWLRRLGLLRIPEELRPPPVLARATALAREAAEAEQGAVGGLGRLLRDAELLAAHRDMLPPPRRPWLEPPDVPLLTGRIRLDEAPTLSLAWEAMTKEERAACLADGVALDVIVARARDEGFCRALVR